MNSLGTRSGIRRAVLATLTVTIACLSAARADNTAQTQARTAMQAPDSRSLAGDSEQFPDVTAMAPRLPTEQELAGDSLHQFIVHHATVHYVNTGVRGNLAHWRGGKQSICPATVGLSPAYNGFVTARIRALAANVGAPLQADPQCTPNVRIFFTNHPDQLMSNVVKWASVYFRAHARFAAMKRLIEFNGDHAIQGWYLTTPRGAQALNSDLGLMPLNLEPVWPHITQDSLKNSGDMNTIGSVVMIVDTSKVVGDTIGTIADYVGVMSLSVVQSPDHCDPLPSILDATATSCTVRERSTAVTAGDLAFLKALYYLNSGLGPSPSRDDIQNYMVRQLSGTTAASR
jgi:hypothetical protein